MEKQTKKAPKVLKKRVGTQRLVAVIALALMFLFFCIFGRNFATYNTFISILDSSYYVGFLAIGITFVIITGGIDLSVGTILVCCSLITGTLINKGLPIALAIIVCIFAGSLFGLLNGFMVSVMRLPAFIATLGTMMITRGLGSIITGAASVTFPLKGAEGGWFRNIFKFTGEGIHASGIPTGFILLLVLAVIMALVLNKTRLGRYILALGSNKEAARLSGVNVVKWETLAYVISGSFAGLGGIAYAAIYSTILPGTGNGYELDAIAAAVIGGTSLSGGVGSVAGTLIGVYIMSVLKTGLPLVGLQPHFQLLFTGIVLVIAVFFDVMNRRKKS